MQTTLQFQAQIQVPQGGYRWQRSGPTPRLICRDALKLDREETELPPERFRVYDPFLETPALFQAFADLDALPWPLDTRDPDRRDPAHRDRFLQQVRLFADQYGRPFLEGEFLFSINLEIHQMRAGIALWEAVRAQDQPTIEAYVRWNQRRRWHLPPAHEYLPTPEAWEEAPRGKRHLVQRAAELVEALIQQKCWREFYLKPVRDADGMMLAVEIDDLAPVLWLQFAFAVVEGKQYRRCATCGRAFEVAPGENRVDRRFCSDRCRIRAYRQRRARAREMRAAGEHLRDIAQQLDSEMAVVKRWVGEA